ncbi:MAG: hypothetical protein ABJD07_00510 [Gemmatimonadaceae bacterium]
MSASRSQEHATELEVEGAGQYELIPGQLVRALVHAEQRGSRSASGQFRQVTSSVDGAVDITGAVTCLAVDAVNHRAWIGGTVTKNRSTDPSYRDDPTTQVGQDVWFRVLDTGKQSADPDRSTFLGFAGSAGITTSAEYCAAKIWPADNARTHPFVTGGLEVEP